MFFFPWFGVSFFHFPLVPDDPYLRFVLSVFFFAPSSFPFIFALSSLYLIFSACSNSSTTDDYVSASLQQAVVRWGLWRGEEALSESDLSFCFVCLRLLHFLCNSEYQRRYGVYWKFRLLGHFILTLTLAFLITRRVGLCRYRLYECKFYLFKSNEMCFWWFPTTFIPRPKPNFGQSQVRQDHGCSPGSLCTSVGSFL